MVSRLEVLTALKKLPYRQRRLIELRYADNRTVQEVCERLKIGKTAFYRQAEMSLADAYRYASEVMTENMMARDAEEGIGAFIEKREPKWTDR